MGTCSNGMHSRSLNLQRPQLSKNYSLKAMPPPLPLKRSGQLTQSMHKKESALKGLLQQKLLPLYYNDDAQVSIRILEALYAAGIRLVEYTNRGSSALANFAAMKKEAERSM